MVRTLSRVFLVLGALLLGAHNVSAQIPFQTPFVIHGNGYDEMTDDVTYDTPNNSPAVAYSIPIAPNQICYLEAFVTVVDQSSGNITAGAAAKSEIMCARPGAGNLAAVATVINPIGSSFATPQPALSFNVNTNTQSVEVILTGRPAQVLRWRLSLKYRISN